MVSYIPSNTRGVRAALLLTGWQSTEHPKILAMDVPCSPLRRLAWSQSQCCCLKFSSGRTANLADRGMCLDLVAGSIPGLGQGAQRLG